MKLIAGNSERSGKIVEILGLPKNTVTRSYDPVPRT